MWILTASANDYNQHGSYFISAWRKKPTADQLNEHVSDWFCGPDKEPATVLLETGGGRQGQDEWWYELFEFQGK